MIDKGNSVSIKRQCEILKISRSGVYYKARGTSGEDLKIMRAIDEIHLKYPFYGSRRIMYELRQQGYSIGRKHIRTLMKKMGVETLYRKPKLSKAHSGHKKYPYLLKGMDIKRSNQVWASDITYIPMAKGYCYLVAIMDWASRRVLSWRVSNTLDSEFCVSALQEALYKYGKPEILIRIRGVSLHRKIS